MKKITILITIILSMIGTKASAYDFAAENVDGVTIYYNYYNNGTELEVTFKTYSYNSYSGIINIPEEVTYMNRTRKVTNIGTAAFSNCSGLTSITIPENVESIGESAFYSCSSLTSVTIPDNVRSIGRSAFEKCSGLKSITIPKNVEKTEEYVFRDCSGLTSVTIDVTSIGSGAFSGCNGLTSVTFSSSVRSIGYSAFQGCSGLTSITIPDYVGKIGEKAFEGCSGLTSVTIGSGVSSIGSSAFSGCDIIEVISKIVNPFYINTNTFSDNTFYNATLHIPAGATDKYKTTYGWKKFIYLEESGITVKNADGVSIYYNFINDGAELEVIYGSGYSGIVNIPEEVTYMGRSLKVTKIGDNAFNGCEALTSVTIPNSVTSIGDHAFTNCEALTSVTIPNSVTSIGPCAFLACVALTSITIPNSVTKIGDLAFYSCYGLNSVTIGNNVSSIGDLAFGFCHGLKSIIIPNSVTSLELYSFYYCSGLTSVTIGSGVSSIVMAFSGCDILELISKIENPFDIEIDTFTENTYKNAKLYVPVGTIDKYKSTQGWKDFCYIEEGGPAGISSVQLDNMQILSHDNVLNISGAPKGSTINVYNLAGEMVGSSKVTSESTDISTSLQSGEVGIVKIGDKAVKILMK